MPQNLNKKSQNLHLMDPNKDSIRFTLVDNEITEFAILKQNYTDERKVKFRNDFSFLINPEEQLVACDFNIEFSCNQNVFLKLTTRTHFKIDSSSWITSIKQKETIVFPRHFLLHITTISLGTGRGVLIAKTEKTEFSKYYIPLINLEAVIKEDYTITLKDLE